MCEGADRGGLDRAGPGRARWAAVELTAGLDAPYPPEAVQAWVADLGRYPRWLSIVPRAAPSPVAPGDPGPAWDVELRGRLGPLARSKRLRMVRRADVGPSVTFERRETDGRSHSAWVLRAELTPTAEGTHLAMHLHYGGSLWGPLLEHMLADEIERSRPRLLACLAEASL